MTDAHIVLLNYNLKIKKNNECCSATRFFRMIRCRLTPVYRLQSTFVKPNLDGKSDVGASDTKSVRGRESRELMAPEYFSPQFQVIQV